MDDYDITAAFEKIEEELIASMIRNMDRHRAEEEKEGIRWSQWQAEQLKALEEYKQRNQKKYKKEFRSLNQKMEELIRLANDAGGMDQESEILEAIRNGFQGYSRASGTMQAEFFKINERKLDALIEATTNDMQKAETAVLRMANDQYRKTIFNAQVYANSGAGTYAKAVDMATKDMLAAGLNCVQYANGARHTLSDYADMAIRTASKRAYLQGEGTKRQEWGISTVILNKRGNPCPKCLPWVGKVLIDDVWSGGKAGDGKYPLMSYAISRGLYHPRCKDAHTTYFPGISTADDTWTKEELEKVGLENREEAKQQYAKRQAEKYGRLEKYSLDEENQKRYQARVNGWGEVANRPDYFAKGVAKDSDFGIIKETRAMANGLRMSPMHILSDDEMASVLKDAEALKIPKDILEFNKGRQTGFSDRHGVIHVRGDILPDLGSSNLRDNMSPRAVLAHEYYGHYKAHPSQFRIGDWRDEFRASYRAAIDAPGLSDEERRMLMLDAYDRAKEAGIPVRYNKTARRIIYGYDE